jgi:hypothetical protein
MYVCTKFKYMNALTSQSRTFSDNFLRPVFRIQALYRLLSDIGKRQKLTPEKLRQLRAQQDGIIAA